MTYQRRRPTRLIAAMLAGALALSASPLLGMGTAGAADPLPPLADPTAPGAFCDGAPTTSAFTDLGGENADTRETIICLVSAGITQGVTPTTYVPGGTVTRRQMALFIQRLADLFNEQETSPLTDLPAYDNVPDYPDVLPTDNGAEAIGQLSQANIVGGFSDGTFRPNEPVSRRQMAAFVNRLQDFLTGDPYTSNGDFFDDDNGDSGETNLNALASVGIFQGTSPGIVNPGGNLTRRQMANILLRDAQVFFAFGAIDSPFGDETNETLTFTPDTPLSVALLNDAVDAPADNRTYTASDLPANVGGYRITLVECSLITDTSGDIVFTEDANTGLANAGTPSAKIIEVNGALPAMLNPTGSSAGAVQPDAGGDISVEIDATAVGCVTPVIYTDEGGANTRLNLDDDNRPTEPFGIAGDFTVTAGASNSTLAITPADSATLEFVDPAPVGPESDTPTDDRTYTVSGLAAFATGYRITLVQTSLITNTGGTFSFTEDLPGSPGLAKAGTVSAQIVRVNGADVAGAQSVGGVQPNAGTITFVVDGQIAESLTPVIYTDQGGANTRLNIAANGQPTEPFGVGGETVFIPAEAPLGANGFTVTAITAGRNSFVSGGLTYFLDGNDTFRYNGLPITQAQFDSILSVGDIGSLNYNPDPAGVSIFDITTDDVDAPVAAPTVAVVNGDAGPTINDARITYTRPATNSPGVTYTLQRAPVIVFGANLVCGGGDDIAPLLATFTNVPTATQAAGVGAGVFVFSDNNPPDGCYSYRVVATSPVSSASNASPISGSVTIPNAPDVTAPTSVSAARTTNVGSLDVDTGDVFTIVFNEAMAAPTAATKIRLLDGDGTTTELTNANSTFALDVTNTTLTITVTSVPTGPAILVPGTTPGIQLPATITDRVGITDLVGNPWNLGGGSDVAV